MRSILEGALARQIIARVTVLTNNIYVYNLLARTRLIQLPVIIMEIPNPFCSYFMWIGKILLDTK